MHSEYTVTRVEELKSVHLKCILSAGGSIGECNTLSQPSSWLLAALQKYSYAYLLVYLLTVPYTFDISNM